MEKVRCCSHLQVSFRKGRDQAPSLSSDVDHTFHHVKKTLGMTSQFPFPGFIGDTSWYSSMFVASKLLKEYLPLKFC